MSNHKGTHKRYSVRVGDVQYCNLKHLCEKLGLNGKSIYKQVQRALDKGQNELFINGNHIHFSIVE